MRKIFLRPQIKKDIASPSLKEEYGS